MIEDKIKEIFSKQFGILPDTVNLSSHIVDDFGADSLDITEITMTLENNFNIAIEDNEMFNIHTVQNLIDFIQSKLK